MPRNGTFKKVVILAMVALLFLSVPRAALAIELEVGKSVERRLTVEGKDHDGFSFELKDGDKVEWYITLVTGDVLDIYLMTDTEHQKLDGGGPFIYFSQYSKGNTDFYEDQVEASGTYVGKLALVVMSQGKTNSSSTYDIEVTVTKAPGPTTVFDMICGLGIGICAVLLIGAIVVVAIVYYIWKRMAGAEEKRKGDVAKPGEKPEIRYIDSMMRPGFDIPITEEPKPKKKVTLPRKRRPAPPVKARGRSGTVSRPARARSKGRCPSCGERVDEDQGYCPSCGSDI